MLILPWLRFFVGTVVLVIISGRLAAAETSETAQFDVIVFGGTPAGVMSAVAAGRAGDKVLLLESSYLIGGLMSGGLTKTDIGKKETIGGLSGEFYDRVVAHYRKTYGAESEQAKVSAEGLLFEPKVAGLIFAEMLAEAKVTVRTKERLEKTQVRDGAITEIVTRHYQTGALTRHVAPVFVDGTYEGDLMAQAGVMYRVGREARAEYSESLAGLTDGPVEYLGTGDHRVQSYNIRGTLTTRDDLRVPIPKPAHYDPEPFENFIRLAQEHNIKSFEDLFDDEERWGMINGKCDPNKADMVGVNLAYSEADYEARERIVARVQDHWLSLWWMLQNDPHLSEEFRASARRWGLPRDEYVESGHVTPQVYVRVARRMQGRYLLTQRDVQYDRFKPDTICMGSYNTDCHEVQRIQTDHGLVGEGHFNASVDPYEIPYRSITPYGVKNLLVVAAISATHVAYSSLRMEPVFMMLGEAGGAAAHLAKSGQVSVQDVPVPALQAALKQSGVPLEAPYRPVVDIRVKTSAPFIPGQRIEFEMVDRHVRTPLTNLAWNFDGSGAVQATTAKASWVAPAPGRYQVMLIAQDGEKRIALPAVAEVVVDGETTQAYTEVHYEDAKLTGRWKRTRGLDIEYRQRVGLVDNREGDGSGVARFATKLPRTGKYLVAVAWPTTGNRATNVPVVVGHAGGETKVTLNQKRKTAPFAFAPIGTFRFEAGQEASVTISNAGADGFVAIDAVRFIPVADETK